MTTFGPIEWRKSSHSGPEGDECVEVADLTVAIGVRDSKNPGGPKPASLLRRAKLRALDL
ncbi:MAG TPA: DUF397 domain-containing protein [Streptosporangiaceae bacterium]|nr:DUF397 domain-containing protein [Streptosporangiaceae bacterium]